MADTPITLTVSLSTSSLSSISTFVSDNKTIASAGLFYGFSRDLYQNRTKLLTDPLHCMLRAIFPGFVTSSFATFVAWLLPEQFKWLLTTLLILASVKRPLADSYAWFFCSKKND